MRFWLKQFFSDGKAHWKAVEEVFFVCGISLIPLFMLAIIDQLRQASPSASELFWGAIASGQLYLYSFSLFGTLFWLCQKEHENFPRFEPRRYLTLLVFVPSVLIVIIYSIEPSMSKPLSHGFVGASFAVYLLYVVLYYVLLVFDHLEPPPVEKGLQEGAGTLIDKYKHLGESLSQATVVKGLLPYISKDPLLDRDAGKRFGFWEPALASANAKRIFYEFFRRDEDERILQIVMNYFLAVSAR
jgi:hypothetical protein